MCELVHLVSDPSTIIVLTWHVEKKVKNPQLLLILQLSMADLNGKASIPYNESVMDHAKL